jgi:hypothetical protein
MSAVVSIVLGPGGTGKSFSQMRWIANEFLPNRTGKLITNLPVHVDALADYCEEVHRMDRLQVLERIEFIPKEVLADWMAEKRGPWDYFADDAHGVNPINKAHIIIDECDNYIPRGHSAGRDWRTCWAQWLGTLRHRGATICFMTQDERKVASEISAHAERRVVLSSGLSQRMPLIGVPYSDFYQLLAKVTGRYQRLVIEIEMCKVGERFEQVSRDVFPLSGRYFDLYDSYNATEQGDSGARGEAMEWERFGWIRFLKWLFWKNVFGLAWRCVVTIVGISVLIALVNGTLFTAVAAAAGSMTQVGGAKPVANATAVAAVSTEASPLVETVGGKGEFRIVGVTPGYIGLEEGSLVGLGESFEDDRFVVLEILPGLGVVVLRDDYSRSVMRVRVGAPVEFGGVPVSTFEKRSADDATNGTDGQESGGRQGLDNVSS